MSPENHDGQEISPIICFLNPPPPMSQHTADCEELPVPIGLVRQDPVPILSQDSHKSRQLIPLCTYNKAKRELFPLFPNLPKRPQILQFLVLCHMTD